MKSIICYALIIWGFNNLIAGTTDGQNDWRISVDDFNYLSNFSLKPNDNNRIRYENKCSLNKLMDKMFVSLTPADYSETINKSHIYRRVKHINETIGTFRRLRDLRQNVSKTYKPIVDRLRTRFSELLLEIDLPNDCMSSLIRIMSGIRDNKQWALRFLNTLPQMNGIIGNNRMPSFDYDECLRFESPDNEINWPQMRGQYCWLGAIDVLPTVEQYKQNPLNESIVDKMNDNYVNFPNKLKNIFYANYNRKSTGKISPKYYYDIIGAWQYSKTFMTKFPAGICIPSTCRPEDIEYAINKILYPITQIPIVVDTDCDYVNKPIIFNGYNKTALITFTILISLTIISTVYELYVQILAKINGKEILFINKILISFSIITNGKILLTPTKKADTFAYLYGVRTIMVFIMMLMHQYWAGLSPLHSKHYKLSAPAALFTDYRYAPFKNMNLIDTFFFITGMITCYANVAIDSEWSGKFNYFKFISLRYLRIMPPTLGAILTLFILPLVGNGPKWEMTINGLYIPCRDNWLSSVLTTAHIDIPETYVEVFSFLFVQFNTCNTANWYASSDFHLTMFAPIVFLVLYNYGKYGIVWNIIVIIVGMFICLAPKLLWDIPYIFEYMAPNSIYINAKAFTIYYWRTEPHLVSYAIGLLCGYLIKCKPKLYCGGRAGELCLWLVCTSGTVVSIYWWNHFWDPYYPLTRLEIYSFLVISKLLYLSGWFWLTYACATGRGGFINKFLSWKGFYSTSVVSFEICIMHSMVIAYRMGIARQKTFYSNYHIWTVMACDYVVTYIIACIFFVIVSAPFANIVNTCFKSKSDILVDNRLM